MSLKTATLTVLACFMQRVIQANGSIEPHLDLPILCPLEYSIRLPVSVHLAENGSVWDPVANVSYPNGTHWEIVWDRARGGGKSPGTEYWGCPCEAGIPCLRKCCPTEEAKQWGSQCVQDDVFCPKNLDDGTSLLQLIGEKRSMALFGEVYRKGVYSALSDSGLYAEESCRQSWSAKECQNVSLRQLLHGGEKYCVVAVPEYEDHPWACQSSYSLWFGIRRLILNYPVGRTLAALCFAATIAVYACIPELRNLHGKMLMSHLTSLLAADIVCIFAIIYSLEVGLDWCLFFGFGIQFFFLSSFFWLNIICYDIFITFRQFGPLKLMRPAEEKRKMIMYSLYAWGAPVIILAVSVTLELVPGLPPSTIKPDFRLNICWFYTDIAGLLYFLGFSSLLLGSNIVLFIMTAVKLFKIRKATAFLEDRTSVLEMEAVKRNKKRFHMYVRLLLMMGFLRTVEVCFRLLLHTNKLMRLADYSEGLNGFLSFVIFVWKDDILSHLKRKFCPCMPSKE
ncbi:probable G-protein coupled receptor Mth-like 10 [Ischnura elegans]|uniref:probable G-protein coupled receptor Mth-like 10 n=1 Tax=Ischnura elegans TaxID=197161 RepID=UPI001ED886AA|nr:probable G-protein coupled receptor Mth-like 10 [Ischnura elegans]